MGDKEVRWGCPKDGHCAADTPKLEENALVQAVAALPFWTLSEDRTTISREFVAKNWGAAIKFMNSMSEAAEEANHHPDVHLTSYRVTQLDLDLAAKLDTIEVDYSPKWLKEHQQKSKPP